MHCTVFRTPRVSERAYGRSFNTRGVPTLVARGAIVARGARGAGHRSSTEVRHGTKGRLQRMLHSTLFPCDVWQSMQTYLRWNRAHSTCYKSAASASKSLVTGSSTGVGRER
eukprot:5040170-Pyramimonas_sp.AAC.1